MKIYGHSLPLVSLPRVPLFWQKNFKTNLHVYPLPSGLGGPLYRSNSWKSVRPNAHVLLQSCRRIKSDFFSPTQEPDTFDHELAPVNFEDLKNDMNTHALSNLNPLAWWLALSAWGAICKRTAPHHEWLGLLQRSSNLHVHGHYWQNSWHTLHTAHAMWSESGCLVNVVCLIAWYSLN